MNNNLTLRIADWHRDNADLRRIREAVFIREQGIPPEQEWDADDLSATHVLAFDNDFAVGTARLLENGEVGRVAVLKEWRGLHIGEAIIEKILAAAQQLGIDQLSLHAQTHAAGFYEQFGFQIDGDEFIEAGILHVNMIRAAP